MEIGQVVKATVDKVEQYGVFLSNESGRIFIQIPELDWIIKIPDARQFTEVGSEFEVLVLAYDDRRKLFSGSIKGAHPELDPYRVSPIYETDTIHEGTVLMNTEYGTFVEIAPGLDALSSFEIGSKLQVKVVEYDPQRRRMLVINIS